MAAAAATAGEGEVDLRAIVTDVGAGQLREPLRYCIAVDGSELSLRTFHAAAMLCCRGDHVTVLHIADPGKSELHQPWTCGAGNTAADQSRASQALGLFRAPAPQRRLASFLCPALLLGIAAYLPYDMRPSSIREQYDVECVGRVR